MNEATLGSRVQELKSSIEDFMYVTHIEDEYQGGVYFPETDFSKWQKIEEEKHEGFTFTKYLKSN